MSRPIPIEQRFWSKVDRGDADECWPWRAGRIRKMGYGGILWNGKTAAAHRVAWELTNGPVPDGACVLHRCDNPPCCNPAHLFLGTKADNNRDARSKGRSRGSLRLAAGNRCKRDHELAGDNLYISPQGRVQCYACRKLRDATRPDREHGGLK